MSDETEKTGEPALPLGFLQMCIDRRFHRAVQERFEAETGLATQQYWLHAEVGGSPGLAKKRREAPDYCYENFPALRDMGWSAHGSKCGGFPGRNDDYILKKLRKIVKKRIKRYRSTHHRPIVHHVFFATDEGIWYERFPPVK
jgi:hypothetical protein